MKKLFLCMLVMVGMLSCSSEMDENVNVSYGDEPEIPVNIELFAEIDYLQDNLIFRVMMYNWLGQTKLPIGFEIELLMRNQDDEAIWITPNLATSSDKSYPQYEWAPLNFEQGTSMKYNGSYSTLSTTDLVPFNNLKKGDYVYLERMVLRQGTYKYILDKNTAIYEENESYYGNPFYGWENYTFGLILLGNKVEVR